MRSQIQLMWRTSPALTITSGLMLVALLFSMAGIWLDPRVITGMPAWVKPAKFAISTAIYSGTLAWLLRYVEVWPRLMRAAAQTTAWMLVLEVAIIDLQAARGTTSHFNVGTPLDGALFGVMGVSILVLWLASVAIAAGLFRQTFRDRGWGWMLRLAMVITVLGAASGGLMTKPTAEQAAERRLGEPVTLNGGHTVGAADGGPGLAGLGWSTEHGDLRIPHFLGLHAIQLLPLMWWLTRRRSVRAAGTFAASYVTLFGILLWQALRGQSVLRPDGLTLWALGIWLAATAIAIAVTEAEKGEALMEGQRA